MTNNSLASLSDSQLLSEATRAASAERRSTAELIALLAEVDARKLYLGLGYSSLFVYCTQDLRLSESAAYARIAAARASRSFPTILTLLAKGEVTLTTISLLAAHLTDENHEALLSAAAHKSRRDVEQLVASLVSQPDISSSVRRLPDRSRPPAPSKRFATPSLLTQDAIVSEAAQPEPAPSMSSVRRPAIAPLAADRYLLRVTLSAQAHERLERARALMRHQIPSGDPAAVIERALNILVEQLERTKHGATAKARPGAAPKAASSRYVPAAVKRTVWHRDRGRCAFVGAAGRCAEVGFLEFHHVIPFAVGGATNAENLQLRCRAHNAYEATLFEQSPVLGRLIAPAESP